jgi:hypothetical protein
MAKQYQVPAARLNDWSHPHPDRTAYCSRGTGMDFDYTCKVWPSKGAMLQACKMSDTGAHWARPWKPLEKYLAQGKSR